MNLVNILQKSLNSAKQENTISVISNQKMPSKRIFLITVFRWRLKDGHSRIMKSSWQNEENLWPQRLGHIMKSCKEFFYV